MDEAAELIDKIRPQRAILTHFGLQVLKSSPERQARLIQKKQVWKSLPPMTV